jgi:hypothetical protein
LFLFDVGLVNHMVYQHAPYTLMIIPWQENTKTTSKPYFGHHSISKYLGLGNYPKILVHQLVSTYHTSVYKTMWTHKISFHTTFKNALPNFQKHLFQTSFPKSQEGMHYPYVFSSTNPCENYQVIFWKHFQTSCLFHA